MSKQTAVQWFYEKIKSHFEHDGDLLETLIFTMSIAKKMEREQIETAYQAGDGDAYNLEETKNWAEQYYNETYGGHSVDANEMIDHNGDVNEMVGGQDE